MKSVKGKVQKSKVVENKSNQKDRQYNIIVQSEEGKKNYIRRMWLVEGSFGLIKAWMGLRQFLCRGLEKVRTEWLWACTAFNLKKLVRVILDIRRKIAAAVHN